MNLDINTLSTLLQLFGQKPQTRQDHVGDDKYAAQDMGNSAFDNYSDNTSRPNYLRDNGGYAPNRRVDAYDAGNKQNISPFTVQNGLGQAVEISSGKKERHSGNGAQSATTDQNPMALILQLLSGDKQQSDGASAMLPLLMNMLKKNDTRPTSPPTKPDISKPDGIQNDRSTSPIKDFGLSDSDTNFNNENGNQKPQTCAPNLRREAETCVCDKSENTHKCCEKLNTGMQNAQNRAIKNAARQFIFKPIEFAGYALISALSSLYRHLSPVTP